MMDKHLSDIAEMLNDELRRRGFTVCTAESCTGGVIAAAITSVPGCSDVFKGSVVAYSNEVKMSVLGVSGKTIEEHGAVSESVVREMVCGVCRLMQCDCAVATSGVAGPGGGTDDKPVGTVWMAVSVAGNVEARLFRLKDEGREKNICTSAEKALSLLLETVSNVNVLGAT